MYSVALRNSTKGTSVAANLTQTEVAQQIGETQTFVSKCERGERRIDVIELRTFCRAFGMSLDQFVSTLEGALRRLRRS